MKFVLAFFVGAAMAQAAVPTAVAIRNARVFTGTGAEISNGTLLIRNGLVEDIGPSVSIPPDAWVVDGSGLTVYPGFIDGLSTWGIPQPPTSNAPGQRTGTAGVTPAPQASQTQPQARSHGPEDRPQTFAFERAADLVSPSDTRLETARDAGFTTAATFPNRGIVEGLGAIVDLGGTRASEMVVAEPIGEQIVLRTAGFRAGFPNSLMGAISYVRQLYLDLDQFKQAQQVYAAHSLGNARPPYDHNLEALAHSPRLLLPADERQQIDRMLAFGRELKQPFALYGMHEAFERVDELKQAGVPVLISLKWPEKPKDGDPAEVPNYRDLVLRDQAPGVPALLRKAGVQFAFFSDGITTSADLLKAIRKAVSAGLAPGDAVKALTLNAAEIYGVADRLGSLEKGKIANLVIAKGSLFDEKAIVQYVFVDGVEYRPEPEEPKEPKRP